jgi:hypothetical protein
MVGIEAGHDGGSTEPGACKAGRSELEGARDLITELLAQPDWARVETNVLGRYTDPEIALAIRMLGGRAAVGADRARLVELLREQYDRLASRNVPSEVHQGL